MSCKDKTQDSNCSLDMGRGCLFCNCQTEPEVKVCEGCFKLHETDWLDHLPDMAPTDIVEIRFKNTRRSYFQNVNGLELKRGDIVAVESSPGHDIGIVSLTGDMVGRQMRRVGFNALNGEFKKIYRKAKPYDIEKWQEAIAMEHETMIRSRQIAAEMGLNMKIGDVEYQGDKIKAIFYYIADERVDFRELIKVFAEQFRIRVEMKQIGARQEAGRIGGLGSCGRELCCASWISSFVSVTTNSARAQEISLNPQKLAGQCSKLKCCLVYELDDYLDARREFPRVNEPLQALDGDYHLVKTDILGRTMSFSTSPNALIGVITLPVARVIEIIELNRRGKKPERLEGDAPKPAKTGESGFVDLLGSESITRFDSEKTDRQRSRRSNRRGGDPKRDGQRREDQRRDDRPQQDNRKADFRKRDDSARTGDQNESKRAGEQSEGRRGGEQNEGRRAGNERRGGDNTRQQGDRPKQNRGENRGENRGKDNRGGENRGRDSRGGDRSGGDRSGDGRGGENRPKKQPGRGDSAQGNAPASNTAAGGGERQSGERGGERQTERGGGERQSGERGNHRGGDRSRANRQRKPGPKPPDRNEQ